jgi:DNA-binding NarL/FixJ family response regulator
MSEQAISSNAARIAERGKKLMDVHNVIEGDEDRETDTWLSHDDGVFRRKPIDVTAARLPHPREAGRSAFPLPGKVVSGKLIYVDARSFTRECIGNFLKSHLDDFDVVLVQPEALDALDGLDRRAVRAVIINSGAAPISSSTTRELVLDLAAKLAGVPQVLLSDHEDGASIAEAFALGVKGYIPTNLASLVAVEVVRLICAGGSFAPASALLVTARPPAPSDAAMPPDAAAGAPPSRFTQRQSQILERLHRGLPNKLIAHELAMSENTVKVHVRTIMKKLRATNRTQVVCLTQGALRAADNPSAARG